MWLCKGIKYSVMSTRLTVVKPSRCSRQVGRSALIWAYIDIIKYNYEVCRQVGRSTGQHQYVGRGATPSSGSGPVITRRLGGGGGKPPNPLQQNRYSISGIDNNPAE